MALSFKDKFDYVVLLSGSDYPLQTASYIERFFKKHKGEEFINIVTMPCPEAGKPISRLINYKSRPTDLKLLRMIKSILIKLGLISVERDYKKYLNNLTPFGGSQWWALTSKACEHIIEFIEKNPGYVNFYKHTHTPDESFFQTILGNSYFMNVIRKNVTYTNWNTEGASRSEERRVGEQCI